MDRYDRNDPKLLIVHSTLDPTVLFPEATEIDSIYKELGIYHEFVPLVDKGHGAWTSTINGKSLSKMSFEFLVVQELNS